MILGIGTDIVEIARIRAAWERNPGHFADTILAPGEKLLLQERKSAEKKAEFLAGRWAAKEAFAKALGTGMGEGCSLFEIEILPDEKGAPVLSALYGKAQKSASEKGVKRVCISISHEKNYAVSTVLLEDISGEKT